MTFQPRSRRATNNTSPGLLFVALIGIAFPLGCGGGGGSPLPTGPTAVSANLTLEYRFSSADREQQAPSSPPSMSDFCVGRITVRAGFRGFAPTNLIPTEAGVWVALFDQVPIGRQVFRFDAPLGCEASHIVANGRVVASELGGAEMGQRAGAMRTWTIALTVHADGTLDF